MAGAIKKSPAGTASWLPDGLRELLTSVLWLMLALCSPLSYAETPRSYSVAQPNLDYTEFHQDLSVKAQGGLIKINRVWTNGRWYVNPAWATLRLVAAPALVSAGGCISNCSTAAPSLAGIDRAGAIYTATPGSSTRFTMAPSDFINATATGWRWNDDAGNWINYGTNGAIQSYGDRNGVTATFVYNTQSQCTSVQDSTGATALSFTYDANGNLNQVNDTHGRRVSYQWSGSQLTQVKDVLGQIWAYQYDSNGQITQRTDPSGGVIKVVYASDPAAYQGPQGWGIAASTQAGGPVTSPNGTATIGSPVQSDVALAGVANITDELGHTTLYNQQYNSTTQQTTTITQTPDGISTTRIYDANGYLIELDINGEPQMTLRRNGPTLEMVSDARGLVTTTQYDTTHNPLSITYADGSTETFSYDPVFHNLLTHTDTLGGVTIRQYDSKGNLVSKTEAQGKPEQRTTLYTGDARGQLLSATVGAGHATGSDASKTRYSYDAPGNLVSQTDALGHTWTAQYNPAGQITALSSPPHPQISPQDGTSSSAASTWQLQYDAAGRLTQWTDPLGHSTGLSYDALGRLTQVTDPLNNSWQGHYDAAGNLIAVTDPLGHTTQYSYDSQGRLLSFKKPSGAGYTLSYDSQGRPSQLTDPQGNVISATYGSSSDGLSGLMTGLTFPTGASLGLSNGQLSAAGTTMRLKYDARNRVSARTLPVDASHSLQSYFGWDAAGNLVTETEPASPQPDTPANTQASANTLYGHDAFGRALQLTDALGGQTRQSWSAQDNRLSLTDAAGNTTTFNYDAAERITSQSKPGGQTTAYTWDDAGLPLQRTDAAGNTRHYGYDAAGHLVQETHTPAGASTPDQTITWQYDAAGRPIGYQQNNAAGQLISQARFTLDALGRRVQENLSYGSAVTGAQNVSFTLGASFDADGHKTSWTYPEGSQAQASWNAGQLQSVTTPSGQAIQYSQWQWNQPTQIQYPNGTQETLAYDALMRVSSIQLSAGSGANAVQWLNRQYSYDSGGQIGQRANPDGSQAYQYGYDLLGRLNQASPSTDLQQLGLPQEAYGYDAVGNRSSSQSQPGPWRYNSNNQLQQWGSAGGDTSNTAPLTQYSYTPTGHTATLSRNGHTLSYAYDAAERLVAISDDLGNQARYSYDPYGRRIAKSVTPAGGPTSTTLYAYASEGLLAELNPQGQTIRAYGWMPQSDWGTTPQWQAEVTAGQTLQGSGANAGVAYTMLYTDHLGTVQLALGANGNLAWRGYAQAFGKTQVDPASSVTMNLRFAGQYFDAETGTHYNWMRDYDSQLGRYRQGDPIGLEGGINLYSYVDSDPLQSTDPQGMFANIVVGGIVGGGIDLGLQLLQNGGDLSCVDWWGVGRSAVYGMAGTGLFRAFAWLKGVRSAAKGPIWSATKSKSAVENAFGHWEKHAAEFPELANSKQYVEAARSLAANPPASALIKPRGADTLIYDKASNTFLVKGADGAPRTMFRPTDGINYWNKQ